MAVSVTATMRAMGLNPPPGARLPKAEWHGQVEAIGDVTGGTVTLTCRVATLGRPRDDLFNLEGVSVVRLDAVADTGLLQWSILEGQFPSPLGHSFQINLTPGGGQSAIRGDQLALLRATRMPTRPDQAGLNLSVTATLDTNTNTVVYRLDCRGYIWDGEVTGRGGPQHP